eukprot:351771-Chlamydomonas_euryale.AAC.2
MSELVGVMSTPNNGGTDTWCEAERHGLSHFFRPVGVWSRAAEAPAQPRRADLVSATSTAQMGRCRWLGVELSL